MVMYQPIPIGNIDDNNTIIKVSISASSKLFSQYWSDRIMRHATFVHTIVLWKVVLWCKIQHCSSLGVSQN